MLDMQQNLKNLKINDKKYQNMKKKNQKFEINDDDAKAAEEEIVKLKESVAAKDGAIARLEEDVVAAKDAAAKVVNASGSEREQELAQRMREGRFDIGATFTEGFESSMYNEALVRQMYEGRKWYVERYPGIRSAVVAFHQDAPLRALQIPQVYSKAGVQYLKASRFSDKIFRWAAPDGSSLLAFEEFHYYKDWANTVPYLLDQFAEYLPQFASGSFPAILPLTYGKDNFDPRGFNNSDLRPLHDGWMNVTGPAWAAFGRRPPPIEFGHVRSFLDSLESTPGFSPPIFVGEKPNLWWAETAPTHHRMFTDYRRAARDLPAAEAFATFRCLLERSWVP